jgi:flagellar protein FlaG
MMSTITSIGGVGNGNNTIGAVTPTGVTQTLSTSTNASTSASAVLTPQAVEQVADTQSAQLGQQGEPDLRQVQDAVGKLNEFVKTQTSNQIAFSIEDSGQLVVKVLDADNQTISQFPSKEAVALSQSLTKLQGLLINHKA